MSPPSDPAAATRDAVRAEYAGLARVYETRWARYVAGTTDRTLAHLALRAGERLLDAGCGTGGRLVLTDWCGDFLACRLAERWLRLRRRPLHRLYRGRECAALLEGAGLRVERLERYRLEWPWGMMTLVARRAP